MVKEVEFYEACKNGEVEKVKKLLKEKKLDVNNLYEPSTHGETAFYAACKAGHVEVVEALLADQRIDKTKSNSASITPFEVACIWGKPDVVVLLMAQALKENPDLLVDTHKLGPDHAAEQMTGILAGLGVTAYKVSTQGRFKAENGEDRVLVVTNTKTHEPLNMDFNGALVNARANAQAARSNYHFFTLLDQAAKDCRGEINEEFSPRDLRARMPFRKTRHAEGLVRCNSIIDNIKINREKAYTGVKLEGMGLQGGRENAIADSEWVLPLIKQFGEMQLDAFKRLEVSALGTVRALIETLKTSRDEGGLRLESEASLNTHLIRLYDNNYYLFGDTKEDAAKLDGKQKITRLISRCEGIEKGLEKVFGQGSKPEAKS